MATVSAITTVYNHLKNIGVSTANNLHITTDLLLVQKSHRVVRIIHSLALKIFGWHIGPNTDMPSVIQVVKNIAVDLAPAEKQQAKFIITVLKTLQKGRDPHLENLASINVLTNKIAQSWLSDENKVAPRARLNLLERQYKAGKDDLALSITNAIDEISLLEGIQEPNKKADQDLMHAIKGYKASVALIAGLFNPILGVAIAATTMPENKRDIKNVDEALKAGANINHQEELSGYTPLIYAAYYGYHELAAHLLSRGACPQMKEKNGYNAYTMASYYLDKERDYLAKLDPQDESYEKQSKHYEASIRRYQMVIDLLKPLVIDQTMPPKRGWW